MAGNRAEMMKLVKQVKKAGFEVDRSGSGHRKVRNPETGQTTTLAFSPKSRGLRLTLTQLKKIGYGG